MKKYSLKKYSFFSSLLVLVMLISVLTSGCVFDDSMLTSIEDNLSEMTAQERQSNYINSPATLGSDSGCANMVIIYPQLLPFVNSFRIVDEQIRSKYLEEFGTYRRTFKLSAQGSAHMDAILSYVFDNHPRLGQMMEEDGVSGDVIANIMRMYLDGNGNQPLFSDDIVGGAGFGVGIISTKMKNQMTKIATNYSTNISDTPNQMVAALNDMYDDQTIVHVKAVMKEIGIYKPKGQIVIDLTPNNPGGSSGGGDKSSPKPSGSPTPNASSTPSLPPHTQYALEYKDITSQYPDLDGGFVSVLDVYETVDGSRVDKNIFAVPAYLVRISVSNEQIAVYKEKDGQLLPVKYSFCEDKTLFFLADEPSHYRIGLAPNHFSDTPGWGKKFIESLYYCGVINGKAENEFMPDETITREEFVKLATTLYGSVDESAQCSFSDVKSDDWFYKYVATAQKAGITQGLGNGSFGTGQLITRQDMCTMLLRLVDKMGFELDTVGGRGSLNDIGSIADYAKSSVQTLYNAAIVSGDAQSNFNPNAFATRQETAKIVYGILKAYILCNQ